MNKFQQDFIIEESTFKFPIMVTTGFIHGSQSPRSKSKFLEIGIDKTESLKLWKGYFGNVNLHGIDIDEKEFNDTEVTLHKIDQSPLELDKFVANVGIKFDVILDDGSHVPEHQILTINKLWNLVKPGGIYIIEDIETSYWKKSKIYGYRFNARRQGIMHEFSKLIDVIRTAKLKTKTHSSKSLVKKLCSHLPNCIIIVKKIIKTLVSITTETINLKVE